MSGEGNVGRLVRGRLWFDDGFAQVPNAWIRDKRLTFTARGVLIWMVSHDANFEITIRGIAAGTSHGVDSIRTAVSELERAGYLKRYRRRERGRIVGTDWALLDPFAPVKNDGQVPLDLEPLDPIGTKKPRSEPERENPDVAQPDVAQPSVANATTKEDHLEEHLTSGSTDQAIEQPVDNSPDSARVESYSEAQSAAPSGDVFDIAAHARVAVAARIAVRCSGRRGEQPHQFEDQHGQPHHRCLHCGTGRPDEGQSPLVVNTTTGEVA